MAFVVTASRRGEPVRSTRTQSASAAVLAMRFAEEGCGDVAIVDGTGARMDIVEFRRRHLAGRLGLRRGRPI